MKYYILYILAICTSCTFNKTVFKESFSNNKNNWETKDNQDFKVSIDNGSYLISKKIKTLIAEAVYG